MEMKAGIQANGKMANFTKIAILMCIYRSQDIHTKSNGILIGTVL